MKKVKEFIARYWIGCWVTASILFALIIHFLFSFQTPNKFIAAKWGAGDILAYASTVALGFLAMWQNQRQKEENDIAQERLEKISLRANEINLINKIVEYQSNRIQFLQTTIDEFSNMCDPQTFGLIGFYKSSVYEQELTKLEKKIDNTFFRLGRLLRMDNNKDSEEKQSLFPAFKNLYLYAKDVVVELRDKRVDLHDRLAMEELGEQLSKYRDIFLSEREKYLKKEEQLLERLLFDDLSLQEVKKIYRTMSQMNEKEKET